MAQVKNTFMASKMNRDVDARILTNNEYRDAINIAVSRSEGDDVGALENIKGNEIFASLDNVNNNLNYGWECIGYCPNEAGDTVYLFLTNFLDSSDYTTDASTTTRYSRVPEESSKFNQSCQIIEVNLKDSLTTIICQGDFLNFSKNNMVESVLIEDQLFWTDNRNQPRKLNVRKAKDNSISYTNEDQISLAKYYPFQSLMLHDDAASPTTTMKNRTNSLLPYSIGLICDNNIPNSFSPTTAYQGFELTLLSENPTAIIAPNILEAPIDYFTSGTTITATKVTVEDISVPYSNSMEVVSYIPNANDVTVGIACPNSDEYQLIVDYMNGSGGTDKIAKFYFHFPNPDYDANWPGDEDYLKERFVRFSYRFKFIDDEYSLTAPFTQACFIPEQFGHLLDYDDAKIKNSQHVSFMKNLVQYIGLRLKLPTTGQKLYDDFHIKEIDIIMKEDKSINMKVLDTIPASTFESEGTDILTYEYNSKKPIETLPESENVRVYDKVPIRAKSIASVGNRVVFGNYVDRADFKQKIKYKAGSGRKRRFDTNQQYNSISEREYPLHSLKQNRTYQVGFVLADRYGRQSDVILSDYDVEGVDGFGGSTTFNKYTSPLNLNPGTWFGDSLKVRLEEEIETFESRYDSVFNPCGWFSFKIVVKQQEQEYYNIYLAGINSLTPKTTVVYTAGTKETVTRYIYQASENKSQIELSGDNINKLPRSLVNVGPLDKKFAGSSVGVYPRVNPKSYKLNIQAFPGEEQPFNADVVSTIAAFNDYNLDTSEVWDFYNDGFPLRDTSSMPVASITSTNNFRMGPEGNESPTDDTQAINGYMNARFQTLGVYETTPVESEIEIFWEATSAGEIINFINSEVVADAGSGIGPGGPITPPTVSGVYGLADTNGNNSFYGGQISLDWSEGTPSGTVVGNFAFVDSNGAVKTNPQEILVTNAISIINQDGQNLYPWFGSGQPLLEAVYQNNGYWSIVLNDPPSTDPNNGEPAGQKSRFNVSVPPGSTPASPSTYDIVLSFMSDTNVLSTINIRTNWKFGNQKPYMSGLNSPISDMFMGAASGDPLPWRWFGGASSTVSSSSWQQFYALQLSQYIYYASGGYNEIIGTNLMNTFEPPQGQYGTQSITAPYRFLEDWIYAKTGSYNDFFQIPINPIAGNLLLTANSYKRFPVIARIDLKGQDQVVLEGTDLLSDPQASGDVLNVIGAGSRRFVRGLWVEHPSLNGLWGQIVSSVGGNVENSNQISLRQTPDSNTISQNALNLFFYDDAIYVTIDMWVTAMLQNVSTTVAGNNQGAINANGVAGMYTWSFEIYDAAPSNVVSSESEVEGYTFLTQFI